MKVRLPTIELEKYILIHQKQVLVEQFVRRSESLWNPRIYQSGEVVELVSLDYRCAIEALYATVNQLK